ncbi:MAG: sporadic carbohydrate cluster protein, TIGR04323 family [Alphaproteobacteria bacterium]
MSERSGYRGYVASRDVRGQRWPQHVQNVVIRDYCAREKLPYLLSVAEYAMEGCYMNLSTVLDELPRIEGIAMFSLFMLPQRPERRQAVYERVLGAGASLHGALEGTGLTSAADIARIEDTFALEGITQRAAGF